MKRRREVAHDDAGQASSSETEDEPEDEACTNSNAVGAARRAIAARLGACEVCAAAAARYSCPKCEVKTCSVRCVRIHKLELECSGVRDRTQFIPLRQMTRMDFMSDYHFLEECTRYVADRRHDTFKRFTRYNKVLPTHLFRLRTAAAERKVALRFLLQNFSRHKENTTFYDWKLRQIFWRVEWIFVNAGGLKYVDERCAETVPLTQLLDKYLNPASRSVCAVPRKRELEYYQSAGVYAVKVLLKAEGIKRSRERFYALDVAKTLKENLAGKTLVEFPCIYLSYDVNPVGFDVIDSDEDVEKEAKSYQESLEVLRQELRNNATAAKGDKDASKPVEGEEQEEDEEKLQKLLAERQCEERQRKRDAFEKAPSNYMFADEKLWDMFSSGSDNDAGGDDTAEEEEEK